jgi:hypothetical protein
MPFNGSGTFTVYTPGNPIANGDTSNATYFNNTMTDFATGLSNTMTKDGQGVPTANIPMGNNKLTGLANGTISTDAAAYGQVTAAITTAASAAQNGSQTYLTAVSGTNTITATLTGLTAYTAGLTVRFTAAGANTGAVTLNIGSLGAINVVRADGVALATGDILSAGTYEAVYDGTSFKLQGSVAASQVNSTAFRSYLAGLTLSTAGSSTTMTASAGVAMDSTNVFLMQLTSAYNKTTSAWAVGSGNGGLDTGTIANNTWYHWFIIRRPDTSVVDVLCSLSPTAPTLPTNYTQYRRIGSGRTNGSGQWTKFFQDGNFFQWDVAVLDVDVTTPTTSAVTRTLSVPTGVRVLANFNYGAYDLTNANQIGAYFSDLSITDTAPSTTAAPLITSQSVASNNTAGYNNVSVWTNTSAQVRSRMTVSSATSSLKIATLGWVDSRGKDA